MDYNKKIIDLFPKIEDLRGKLATNPNHVWKKRDPAAIKGLCLHQELGWSAIEDVAKYHTGPLSHLKKGGVHSISYTIGVRKNGSICLLNDIADSTWSQGYVDSKKVDENSTYIGVLFEGLFKGPGVTDKTAGDPSTQQMTSAKKLWTTLKDFYGWNNSGLTYHAMFGKPACPGYVLQDFANSIRSTPDKLEKTLFKIDSIDFTDPKNRQKTLQLLGYKVTVDGMWGAESKAHLTKCQKDLGLVADGSWGPATQKKIVETLQQKNLLEKLAN